MSLEAHDVIQVDLQILRDAGLIEEESPETGLFTDDDKRRAFFLAPERGSLALGRLRRYRSLTPEDFPSSGESSYQNRTVLALTGATARRLIRTVQRRRNGKLWYQDKEETAYNLFSSLAAQDRVASLLFLRDEQNGIHGIAHLEVYEALEYEGMGISEKPVVGFRYPVGVVPQSTSVPGTLVLGVTCEVTWTILALWLGMDLKRNTIVSNDQVISTFSMRVSIYNRTVEVDSMRQTPWVQLLFPSSVLVFGEGATIVALSDVDYRTIPHDQSLTKCRLHLHYNIGYLPTPTN